MEGIHPSNNASGALNPAVRYRSGEGMIFSSTKCPPGPGLENSCELPFGFLWTPMAPMMDSVASSSRTTGDLPPILCVTCLAYCNLYAQIIEKMKTGNNQSYYWMCPFCKCENVIPSASSLFLSSSGDDNHPHPQPNWMVSPTIEFRQPLVSEQYETIVIVIDTNLPAGEAMAIGNTLKQVVLAMGQTDSNNNYNLGLILFGKNVHIYQLGWSSGMALCDVVATHQGWNGNVQHPSSSSSSSVSSYLTTHTDIQSVLTCIAAQFGVLENTNPIDDSMGPSSINNNNHNPISTATSTKSRMQILKERKEARLRKQQTEQQVDDTVSMNDAFSQRENGSTSTDHTSSFPNGGTNRLVSPWVTARQQIQSTAPPWRCTGEAIQCAIDLIMAHEESVHNSNNHHHHLRSNTKDRRNNTSNDHLGISPPSRTARVLLFTNGCPNHGDGSVVENPESDNDGNDTYVEQQRAPKAIRYSSVDPGKLARASEYFAVIAKAAAEGGIGFDVFCTGSSELGLPAYQALVEPSSGYVISHDTFVTPHLQHNIQFLLQQTSMSLAHFLQKPITSSSDDDNDSDYDDGMRQRDSIQKIPQKDNPVSFGTWIEGCTVDFRMSSFLNPTHLIGPGDLHNHIDGPLPNEEHAFECAVNLAKQQSKRFKNKAMPSLDMLESSLTRIRLGRFDPLSTFSVMLRLNDFFQRDEYAFFQGVVRYTDRESNCLITRVTTHRLSVANNVGEVLEGIDEEVVPVLLGKEAVYRSTFGRDVDSEHPFHAPHAGELDSLAYNAQRDLDCTIFRISAAFRLLSLAKGTRTIDLTEEGGVRAAGSSMDFAFPPELSDALRRLYHLRRGPFLSPGPLQSMDDRTEMRSYFLRFPLEDCLEMMAPSLWSSGPLDEALARKGPSLEIVPPDTLALWENRIIAADHWHALFVYSGSAATKSDYDEIRQQLKEFLLDRTWKRFPMPNLYMLNEKGSMSRRFTTLLAPLHSDPVEHQLAHFPALALLSIPEQEKLKDRFQFYDADSDPSFRKWFWDVASAASSSGEDGISLCE